MKQKTTKKYVLGIILAFAIAMIPAAARADDELDATAYLWRMINEARVHPIETIRSLGIDEANAREALGDDAWVLDQGLAPLAWNQKLFASAGAHVHDMIQHVYYAYNSPDGKTPAERMKEAGYPLLRNGELLGVVTFAGYFAPTEAAGIMFRNMVRDELKPAGDRSPVIFNPYLSEIGVSLQPAVSNFVGNGPQNLYLAVADLGEPAVYRVFLIGNVYNQAGGIPGVTVTLRAIGDQAGTTVTSWSQGAYQFPLPSGFLMLEAKDGAGQVLGRSLLFGGRKNRMVDVVVGK